MEQRLASEVEEWNNWNKALLIVAKDTGTVGTTGNHEGRLPMALHTSGMTRLGNLDSITPFHAGNQTLRMYLEENSDSTTEETLKPRSGHVVVRLDHRRLDHDVASPERGHHLY